jgi:hypothetical protein
MPSQPEYYKFAGPPANSRFSNPARITEIAIYPDYS